MRTSSLSYFINRIEKYPIVSFDIFDTLIKRDVIAPEDVFKLLELKFQKNFGKGRNIYELRMAASKLAERNKKSGEITLEDIYQYIQGLSIKELEWLQHEEEIIEIEICHYNPIMREVYKWCLKHNKRIIIISDMYLDKKIIEKILYKNGYTDYQRLYLSSEYGVRKSKGELIRYCLEQEAFLPNKMIHIGDAWKGDYILPRGMGIATCHVKRNSNNLLGSQIRQKKAAVRSLEGGIIYSFINNRINPSDEIQYRLGYECLGPILYGYSLWLHNRIQEQKISRVFFLTREGELLKKAYEILYPAENSSLLRVSRYSLSLAMTAVAQNFDDLILYRKRFHYFTLKELLKECCIDVREWEKITSESGVSLNRALIETDEEEKEKLFVAINRRNCEGIRQYQYLCQYLLENKFEGKVAVADVGWQGTMQHYLQRLMPESEVLGFYVGKKKSSFSEQAEGYMFENDLNQRCQNEIMFTANFFENCFMGSTGTTKGYICRNNKIIPIIAESEQPEETLRQIGKLQLGALDFVKDFMEFHFNDLLLWNPNDMELFYGSVVNPMRMWLLDLIDGMRVEDVLDCRIISDKSLAYYLVHWKAFIRNFLHSASKMIFLKSVLRIPFPYFGLLHVLKKLEEINENEIK